MWGDHFEAVKQFKEEMTVKWTEVKARRKETTVFEKYLGDKWTILVTD